MKLFFTSLVVLFSFSAMASCPQVNAEYNCKLAVDKNEYELSVETQINDGITTLLINDLQGSNEITFDGVTEESNLFGTPVKSRNFCRDNAFVSYFKSPALELEIIQRKQDKKWTISAQKLENKNSVGKEQVIANCEKR